MTRWKKWLGADNRTILMRKNILVSLLLKGWSGFVFLALVPLTLSCLGTYNNGIWLTISSMLVWIDHLDIGLGNGLRNRLTTHLAHDERVMARKVTSNTFFMLLLIIMPVMLLLLGGIAAFDMFSLLNVVPENSPQLTNAIAVAVIFVCATFVFKFIGNFYMGLQLPAVSNLIMTCGHTLTLVLTVVAWLMGCHSLVIIAAINTCSPLLAYLMAYPYTFFYRYPDLRPTWRDINWTITKSLIGVGVKFFLLQIAGVLLFMSSTILISKIFSPEMVNPYQICYRYFTILLIVFTIISTPIWSATNDAYARGDEEWIRNCRRRIDKVMRMVMLALTAMVLVSQPVYAVWLHGKVDISILLTALMAVYMLVVMYSLSYSNFLNGIGALHLQLIFTCTAAVVFIPLTILITHWYPKVEGVLIAMIAVNLPGLFVNRIQFNRIINHQAKGLWIK